MDDPFPLPLIEDLLRKSLGNKQEVLIKRATSAFEEYYRRHCLDNSVLYPGVRQVLEYFKDKQKV